MAFVKLDVGILNSSLWIDREARDVFITALCMAVPHELTEPIPAISVRTLEPTGFVVQEGWYGIVKAAGPGIVRQACVDAEPGMKALERLSTPDPDSRTPDHEGRRLVRIAGGWIVLNFDLYRQRDQTAAERAKRYRDRKRTTPSHTVTRDDRDATANVTEAEVEAEAEADIFISNKDGTEKLSAIKERVRADWNRAAESRKGWRMCTIPPKGELGKLLSARCKDPEWLAKYPAALEKMVKLSWMDNAKFETFLRPDTLRKIFDEWTDGNQPKVEAPLSREMQELLNRVGSAANA